MVLLVQNNNSLAIVLVLYIHIFTSPFHEYHKRSAAYRWPGVDGMHQRGKQSQQPASSTTSINKMSTSNQHLEQQTTTSSPIMSYQKDQNEYHQYTMSSDKRTRSYSASTSASYHSESTTEHPTPNKPSISTSGQQNVGSASVVTGDETGETLIVSDKITMKPEYDLEITTTPAPNGKRYCDKLSQLKYENHPMECIDSQSCYWMGSNPTGELVRSLSCALKADGSIKVCCKLDALPESESSSSNSREISKKTGNTPSDHHKNSTSEAMDNNDPSGTEVIGYILGRSSQSNETNYGYNNNNMTTITIKDKAKFEASQLILPANNSNNRNSSMKNPASDHELSTMMIMKKPKEYKKFPFECGHRLTTRSIPNGIITSRSSMSNQLTASRTTLVFQTAPPTANLRSNNTPGFADNNEPPEAASETRIIGGDVAPQKAWPWFGLVYIQRRLNGRKIAECGSTLITNKLVLTAAHCIVEPGSRTTLRSPAKVFVRLGESNLKKANEGELELPVRRMIVHPDFQPNTFKNDIALLELDRKVSQLITI